MAGHGARCGLAAMALTDHDTVEGCARMALACRNLGIEFVPGAELTAELEGSSCTFWATSSTWKTQNCKPT